MMEVREYSSYNEEEILTLYSSVGWTAYTDHPGVLKKGFVRVVGDGYTIIFIQDLLVFPEYQRKGIGTVLVQQVLERFRHVRQIELATDNTQKTIRFYKSLGFQNMSEIGCCGFIKMSSEMDGV